MGLGIIGAGLVIGWAALSVKVIPLYARVGPAAFLWVAAGLLALCGGLVAWHSLKPVPSETTNEIGGPLVILAGLLASPLLMAPLGFIPTAAVIFTATAYGLGSRKTLRDAIIGIALSTIAFLIFSFGLNLNLPTGSLFS
jgi:putative tricarboxylic transport membrane protein